MLIILALVLVNGVFAGAEIAVISVRKTRLAELVEQRSRGAWAVKQLRDDPERFLATVQVGITVVGSTAAAFGGATLAAELAPLLAELPGIGHRAQEISVAVVVVLVSYLSLVLGELVPKSLALRKSETYALLIARPLLWLAWAARPVVWLLTLSSNVVLKVFGDSTSFTEARLSREELQQLMDEAATAGSLHADAGEIASRALDFEELDASAIMIPRTRIDALPTEVDSDRLFEMARERAHTRLPVYDGEAENFIGVINLRDALTSARSTERVDLRPLLHPIEFVPEWMSAPELLRMLQRRRAHLALVVDEHGSVLGLVTMEDVVEELVGDILSEHEVPTEIMRRQPDGSVLLEGAAPVHAVNRELGIDLPEGETFSTVAGLCLDLAGRIPRAGTRLPVGPGLYLEIVDATPRRIRQILIVRERPDGGRDWV